jgi:ferric iron reductase protein FhuF
MVIKEGEIMKYTQLLSISTVVGAKTSAPTIEEMKEEIHGAIKEACDKLYDVTSVIQPKQPSTIIDEEKLGQMIDSAVAKHIPAIPENPSVNNELNDTINQMMQCMKELAEKDNSAPKDFNSYSLNDDQITFVLSLLLEYQDKYFKDVPLAKALKQDFMWNIPLEVYDAAVAAVTYGYPDSLNPIFWFYIMCTEVPHDMIGMFVLKAVNSMKDEDFDAIDTHAAEYRKLYLTPEDDDSDDEVPSGNTSIESFDPEIEVEVIGEE